ncbi:MAG TPA: hypothetical protein ENN65_00110, partial [Candidatus Hydrogenedentes bacterium]|nr:hypothetical protein [Candidatus Hydrogenedentota bacterium]
ALDTRSAGMLYDWQWDGYDLTSQSPETIRAAVRGFGRRAFRAFIEAHPETELIIIADDLLGAGPLWFDLFEGLVESVGAADAIPLHLLFRESCRQTRPETLRNIALRAHRLALLRLSASSRAIWRRQGAVGLGMAPLDYEGERPVAHYSWEAFRVQAHAVKTYSDGYAWVDAPLGGWWRVTVDEMTDYLGLYQGFPAGVVETLPLLPDFERYAPKTLLDGLVRVGEMPVTMFGGVAGMVFRDGERAAVLFWDGPEGGEWQEDAQGMNVTDPITGVLHALDAGESGIALGFEGPALIRGAPADPLLLEAGLWMRLEEPFSAERSRTGLAFGFANRTDTAVSGSLELVPPTGYGIGAGTFRLRAEPGATVAFQRTVQGIFQSGDAPEFRLLLMTSDGKAFARRFQFQVAPALRWSALVDGVPAGPPALVRASPQSPWNIVTVDHSGEAVCRDATGESVWRRQFRGRFYAPPLMLRIPGGAPLIALIDHRGIVRFLDMLGDPVHVVELGGPCSTGHAIAANLFEEAYDVLLVFRDDRRLACLSVDAERPIWEYAVGGNVVGLYHASLAGDDAEIQTDYAWSAVRSFAYVATTDPNPAIICLDAAGGERWKTPLQHPPTGSPRIARIGEGRWLLLVPASEGHLYCLEPLGGALRKTVSSGRSAALRDAIVVQESADVAPDFVFADETGVYRYSEEGEMRWRVPFSGARRLSTVTLSDEPAVIVTSDSGALWAVSLSGGVRWRDERAAGPLLGPAMVADIDGDQRMECLYLSADRLVRVIDPGPGVLRQP